MKTWKELIKLGSKRLRQYASDLGVLDIIKLINNYFKKCSYIHKNQKEIIKYGLHPTDQCSRLQQEIPNQIIRSKEQLRGCDRPQILQREEDARDLLLDQEKNDKRHESQPSSDIILHEPRINREGREIILGEYEAGESEHRFIERLNEEDRRIRNLENSSCILFRWLGEIQRGQLEIAIQQRNLAIGIRELQSKQQSAIESATRENRYFRDRLESFGIC